VAPVVREGRGPIPVPRFGRVVAFPDLRAAAGWEGAGRGDAEFEHEEVALPGDLDREGLFAVRASGSSREGFRSEIRDGDWLVMRWARGQGMPTLKGRIVLIARGDPVEGQSYHLKRVVKRPSGYVLHSDNPEVDDRPAEPHDRVVAILEEALRPEALAPPVGHLLAEEEIAGAFGLSEPPAPPWSRVEGHLFLLLDEGGAVAPEGRIETLLRRLRGDPVAPRRAALGTPYGWGREDRRDGVAGGGSKASTGLEGKISHGIPGRGGTRGQSVGPEAMSRSPPLRVGRAPGADRGQEPAPT